MKNTTLVFLIFLVAQFLHAQETQSPHSFVLGGSVSFTTQTNGYPLSIVPLPVGGLFTNARDDIKSTYLSVAPFIGRQLSDRWMAGIDLYYQLRKYDATTILFFPGQVDTVNFKRDGNDVGFGLFARYSFMPENRFDFFLEPYAQYFIVNEKEYIDDELDSEEKANYISVGSDLGVLYNINDRWRAILRIGGLRYVNGSWEEAGTTDGNDFSSFGLNVSLASLGLGVEVKL